MSDYGVRQTPVRPFKWRRLEQPITWMVVMQVSPTGYEDWIVGRSRTRNTVNVIGQFKYIGLLP